MGTEPLDDLGPLEQYWFSVLPQDVCEKYRVFPLGRRGTTLIVATAEPDNMLVLDELRFLIQREIEPVPATERAITAALARGPVLSIAGYFRAPRTDHQIADGVDALFWWMAWNQPRFLRIDDGGISSWRDQWKRECELAAGDRERTVRTLRMHVVRLQQYQDDGGQGGVGIYLMTARERRVAFIIGIRPNDADALIECLTPAEFEDRHKADRLAPELPVSSPYR